jgi:hypothetical protein
VELLATETSEEKKQSPAVMLVFPFLSSWWVRLSVGQSGWHGSVVGKKTLQGSQTTPALKIQIHHSLLLDE